MVQSDRYWLIDGSDFYDVVNQESAFCMPWKYNLYEDFICLSESYYSCAHTILSKIVNSSHDNEKCDMWFLPGMYMYRQAIELLCKSLIIPQINNKNQLTAIFVQYKHNLKGLLEEYIRIVCREKLPLNEDEIEWLAEYISNLETVDKESDLFRYPFKDDFMNLYANDFLDIVDMANGVEQCYSILFKCLDSSHDPMKYASEIDCSISTDFLHFATHGFGNCQLYESPWGDGFYKQVVGYSEAAEYIFSQDNKSNGQKLLFPIAFLLRNAIELSLKRLLFIRNDFRVSDHIKSTKKNSHLLYRDLWKHIKPIIEHYAKDNNEDLLQIDIAEDYIKKLSVIDKNGDVFRYPVNYGLQYRFVGKILDFEHIYGWMQGIFNFLDGCNDMISAIYDFECEMRSDYFDY